MIESKNKDAPLLAAIPYLLGSLISLIVYLFEKEDRFVRFNSLQALILHICSGAVFLALYLMLIVVSFATFGLGIVLIIPFFMIVPLYVLGLLYLAYKAYKLEYIEVPIIGQFVLKYV